MKSETLCAFLREKKKGKGHGIQAGFDGFRKIADLYIGEWKISFPDGQEGNESGTRRAASPSECSIIIKGKMIGIIDHAKNKFYTFIVWND